MNPTKIFSRVLLGTMLTIMLVAEGVAPPRGLAAQAAPQRLTLSEAQAIIAAAQRDAASKNLRLSIAVVDGRGDLIAATRMPNSRPTTMDTVIGKAMGAAIFGRPSADLAANSGSPLYRDINEATGGRLRFFQGAVPIVRDGFTVGAVGASGASAQDDEDNVKAALAAVEL
jgi:glc operon protein GlcG